MPSVDWTIALCIIGGVALAFQAGINGTLGRVGRNPVFASLWSFTSGLVPLVIYWLATSKGGSETDFAVVYDVAPWYAHFGGIMGTLYVLMIVFLAPRLGAAAILSTAVTSQMTTALILDNFGAVGLKVRRATAGRIVGVLLSVLGVALIMGAVDMMRSSLRKSKRPVDAEAVTEEISIEENENKHKPKPSRLGQVSDEPPIATTDESQPMPPASASRGKRAAAPQPKVDWTITFAVGGGAALALQAAFNGKLGQLAGGGYSAAFSFLEGTIVLLVYFLYDIYFGPTSKIQPKWSVAKVWAITPKWSWVGGFLGAAYVLFITITTPTLGATTVLGTSVCSQVVGAVVCDHFAWVGLPRKRANWQRLLGLVVIIGGVVMITVL